VYVASDWTLPSGSRLCRTVPVILTGSCGMVVRLERICWRGRVERSMPSMRMVPERSSSSRSKLRIREDLPLKQES
jgi:hypothetical protein